MKEVTAYGHHRGFCHEKQVLSGGYATQTTRHHAAQHRLVGSEMSLTAGYHKKSHTYRGDNMDDDEKTVSGLLEEE